MTTAESVAVQRLDFLTAQTLRVYVQLLERAQTKPELLPKVIEGLNGLANFLEED